MKEAIRLMPIDLVKGAEYNPRVRVPERFAKLIDSLKHLGFVLPLYVNKDGMLLSGHQRTAAAKELGYKFVPVVDVDISEADEKGLNVFFNRATNDFEGIETSKDVFDGFSAMEASIDFDNLEVIEPDTRYPCMESQTMLVETLFKTIQAPSDASITSTTTLATKGIRMPVVISESGKVLNGVPRVYAYQFAGHKECEVVTVPDHMAEYATWVLNGISMDFNIQEAYADELRYNAYRRLAVQAQMVGFSRTYSWFPMGRTIGATRGSAHKDEDVNTDLGLMPHLDPEVKRKYKEVYEPNFIDFGCGTGHDAELLAKGGWNVLSFEPYRYGDDKKICSEVSRAKNLEFLTQLEGLLKTNEPRSILSSYVLNSIPHHKDRMAYLAIMSAMAAPRTKVYIGTQHVSVRKGSMRDKITANMEPNMTIGDTVSSFKVQKYFYNEELESMLKVFWVRVKVVEKDNTIYALCEYPKRPSANLLKEALELEFNLPYADGTTMNLHEYAKQIFGAYHKLDLS